MPGFMRAGMLAPTSRRFRQALSFLWVFGGGFAWCQCALFR